jgi:hypothetical protein
VRWTDDRTLRQAPSPERPPYFREADLTGLGGRDEPTKKNLDVYLHVGGRIDFRFINHQMTADQARELGTLLIEAAHLWDEARASSS